MGRVCRKRVGRLGAVVSLLWATMTSGCGATFGIVTPPGFIELEDQEPSFEYRSVNADGVVIGVRRIDHEPKGDPDFWRKLVEARLLRDSGYTLEQKKLVKAHSGQEGTQFRFVYDDEGRRMKYMVTLFVTEKYLYLVEFGGTQEQMDRQGPRLDWVLANFRIA